ncbi:hypothetical protein [Secundilactobacillus collinoides]|uniref:hypothetical protein n=1 Tax=Secundilactobacillus collinoides TaxID=33960 RepID=UPI000A4C5D9C|nr:hypothetical protein [Secundilactobacillus collinoides]
MFMSTGAFNQPHVIKGVAAVTCHTQLTSEKPDQFELFDQLFDEAKQKLYQKAAAKKRGWYRRRFL